MDIKNKTIAVTGASGMIGAYICRALLREGAQVRGVVRNPQKAAFLEKEGAVFAQADLNDRASLIRAFHEADAIVSNAAMFSLKKMYDWDENYKANKEGTENVYLSAHRAGVKRIVQISTFGIYRQNPFKALTEEATQERGDKRKGGAYRATKQMSEVLAWKLSKEHNLDLTALRPTVVYGARDLNFTSMLRRFMEWPLLILPTHAFPIVYAGDVAEAVVGALKNDASIGKAYNTGGSSTSLYDFIKAWKEVKGKGPCLIPFPSPLGLKVNNSRAEADLGFKNRPFVEAFREMAQEETL